jgi:hypothetical protein
MGKEKGKGDVHSLVVVSSLALAWWCSEDDPALVTGVDDIDRTPSDLALIIGAVERDRAARSDILG